MRSLPFAAPLFLLLGVAACAPRATIPDPASGATTSTGALARTSSVCTAADEAGARARTWAVSADAWPRLRDRLVGAWHGTTKGGGAVDVSYRAIAGGSALAETFGGPTRATMTLFHPDHGGLVATHYCAQGNQPRLRAVDVQPDSLRFAEADVTDLDPDEAHLVELGFEFGPDGFDRIEDYRAPDGATERTRWHFVRATDP